jgi:hypothetical protein
MAIVFVLPMQEFMRRGRDRRKCVATFDLPNRQSIRVGLGLSRIGPRNLAGVSPDYPTNLRCVLDRRDEIHRCHAIAEKKPNYRRNAANPQHLTCR